MKRLLPAAAASALTLSLVACAPTQTASPTHTAQTASPTPEAGSTDGASTGAVDGDLTFEDGASIPDGMDTVVSDSLIGEDGWERIEGATIAEVSHQQTSTGCIVTQGVYDQGTRTNVGDRQATAQFLSNYLHQDLSGIEPIPVQLPWLGESMFGATHDLASGPVVELLGYQADTPEGPAMIAGRTLEKVGKSFLFKASCPGDMDQTHQAYIDTYGLIGFGIFTDGSF